MTATSTTTDLVEPENGHRRSLLARARNGELAALATMFGQYLPSDEPVIAARYLGTQGVWGIGMDSFACVTARRISSLRVGPFGEVVYQDADVRDVNSGALHQPSRLQLYLFVGVLSIMTCGIGLLLLPLTVRLFYRFKKSGLIVWVKEGCTLHVFSDRKLVGTTNELYRLALTVRADLPVAENSRRASHRFS